MYQEMMRVELKLYNKLSINIQYLDINLIYFIIFRITMLTDRHDRSKLIDYDTIYRSTFTGSDRGIST